jgi:hypothetical protein
MNILLKLFWYISILGLFQIICAEKVYIYIVSTERSINIQQMLQSKCNITEIIAFSRYVDFKSKVETEQPDVIVTHPRIIQQLPDYSIRLRGIRNGKNEEPYVIITGDSSFSLSSVTSKTNIGTIDVFGRSGTASLFSTLFSPPPPMPQRVSKIEDLPLLITYNMAQAVMLFEKDVPYFKQRTIMKLFIVPLPNAKEGIITAAVKNSEKNVKFIECLRENDTEINQLLGIDSWR